MMQMVPPFGPMGPGGPGGPGFMGPPNGNMNFFNGQNRRNGSGKVFLRKILVSPVLRNVLDALYQFLQILSQPTGFSKLDLNI